MKNPISHDELMFLAIKLREAFYDCEEKGGTLHNFSALKDSADALVAAILEPVEFHHSAAPPKKPAQPFAPVKAGAVIPTSLH